MPLWSREFIEPPWSKKHTVTLQTRDRYDELARKGGSDKIERHKPLSLAGGHGRKAGASDMYEESHDDGRVNRDESHEDTWRDDLEDGSKVVSVRDVKNAVPNYKTLQPQHHAFARFVLPVSSTAFSEQDWPGKKVEEKEQQDRKKQSGDTGDNEKEDELSPEIQRFLDLLLQEEETQRSFENNDGKPDGELKLLDQSAVEQLEPTLSVEDQSTPDSWVPRSARLLRLAGVHPVNAEPDVTEMFDAGMITPTKYVLIIFHDTVFARPNRDLTLVQTGRPANEGLTPDTRPTSSEVPTSILL